MSPTGYTNDIVSQFPFIIHRFIVLYADEILLMAPPVTELQRLLTVGETEFNGL